MAYDDLRDWIKALEKKKEIHHIREAVDPILEIAEIADRVAKAGQPGGLKGYPPGGPRCCLKTSRDIPGKRF